MKFISALDTLTLRHERFSIFFLTWLKYPINFIIFFLEIFLFCILIIICIRYKVYHFAQSIENILFKKENGELFLFGNKKILKSNNMCKLFLFQIYKFSIIFSLRYLKIIVKSIDIYLTSTQMIN